MAGSATASIPTCVRKPPQIPAHRTSVSGGGGHAADHGYQAQNTLPCNYGMPCHKYRDRTGPQAATRAHRPEPVSGDCPVRAIRGEQDNAGVAHRRGTATRLSLSRECGRLQRVTRCCRLPGRAWRCRPFTSCFRCRYTGNSNRQKSGVHSPTSDQGWPKTFRL